MTASANLVPRTSFPVGSVNFGGDGVKSDGGGVGGESPSRTNHAAEISGGNPD